MEPVYMDMLRALEALGGRASNKQLMTRMDVTADQYVAIKEAAVADGVISKARGRGGFVKLKVLDEKENEVES